MKNKETLTRVYVVYIIVLLLGGGVVGQIFYLQFYKGSELIQDAEKQIFVYKNITAPRGNIYASNDQKTSLALSVPRFKVYVDLLTIKDRVFKDSISVLSDSLHQLLPYRSAQLWQEILIQQRENGNRYFFIARNLNNSEIERLKRFPIFNLGQYRGGRIIIKTNQRIKPYGLLANRTIGYVVDHANEKPILVGLEGAFNDYLKGQNGQMLMEKVRGNDWKPVDDNYSIEPVPGSDIYTSLDVNIQDVAEAALLHQLKEQKADRGCVILMEVNTGFVKAIANLSFNKKTDTYFESQNHAVGLASEPGSTFKLASLLVALEQGKLNIQDSVYMSGRYEFYDKALTDGGKVYGNNTVKNAFEVSSNVVSKLIYDNYKQHPQEFVDGLKKLGLNRKLGLDIPGEGAPLIKDASDPTFTGISLPWMSIGYEVKLTPLQTLAFYNGVANEGVLMKPQFVKYIKKGVELEKEFEPIVLNSSLCSDETLGDLKELLEGVVERGTAKNIKARGFKIAGKTGTSKIAIGSSGYGKKYQASFCGYFPATNPLYSCIVVIQGPTKNIFGSVVSGTVFKEIADKIYAHEFNQSDLALKIPDQYPYSRPGSKVDFITAAKAMKIPLDDKTASNSSWINTKTSRNAIKISDSKEQKGVIPNVVGMGLVDAAYLLEKNGLVVHIEGVGIVRKQSLRAGLRIKKGQTIKLFLA